MQVTSFLIEAHVFRKNGDDLEFLLMKRSKEEIFPDIWQMVTGTINEEEKAYSTAIREIREETGLTPVEIYVVPFMNSFYSPEKDLVCMVPVFAALVDSGADVIISQEHSEYGWYKKDNAKRLLAWEGQRKSVDVIYEYFTNEKSFLEFVKIDIT